MSPRLPLRSIVVATLVLAAPLAQLASVRGAAAQPASPDKTRLAKQYVKQGLAAQRDGRHDDALALYGKAYEAVPHPVLLFNMAQAHRLAGRPAEARELYRQYLAAEPKGSQAQTARELVLALDAQLAALERQQRLEALAAEAKAAEERKSAEAARIAEAEAEAARKAEAQSAPPAAPIISAPAAASPPSPPTLVRSAPSPASSSSPSSAEARGRNLRLAGLATAGAGVVGVGVGISFHLRATSLSDELSEPGAPYDRGKIRDGESAERMMYVAYAAGGALVVGGAALYLLGRRARGEERLSFVPAVSSHGGGLVVSGSWR